MGLDQINLRQPHNTQSDFVCVSNLIMNHPLTLNTGSACGVPGDADSNTFGLVFDLSSRAAVPLSREPPRPTLLARRQPLPVPAVHTWGRVHTQARGILLQLLPGHPWRTVRHTGKEY